MRPDILELRLLALGISLASAGSMLYVGLYQSRVISRLVCPLFAGGCEAVADAPFARPFGVPDGYIGATLYTLVAALLFAPTDHPWIWIPLLALSVLAALANVLGIRDMLKLGKFCFYCVLTALLSPVLLWAVWSLK